MEEVNKNKDIDYYLNKIKGKNMEVCDVNRWSNEFIGGKLLPIKNMELDG